MFAQVLKYIPQRVSVVPTMLGRALKAQMMLRHSWCGDISRLQANAVGRGPARNASTKTVCMPRNRLRKLVNPAKEAEQLFLEQLAFAEQQEDAGLPIEEFDDEEEPSSTLSTGSLSAHAEKPTSPQSDVKLPKYCSGCGIRLQAADADSPGFFQVPKRALREDELDDAELQDETLIAMLNEGGPDASWDAARQSRRKAPAGNDQDVAELQERANSHSYASSSKWRAPTDDEVAAPVTRGRGQPKDEIDALVEAFGQAAEGWVAEDEDKRPQLNLAVVDEEVDANQAVILCQRCWGLKHNGKVKNLAAESLLPEFDLAKKVGRKMALQKFRSPTVLCVVDVADFDGSLPRMALRQLIPHHQDELPPGMNMVIAVNKADLLPKEVTPYRLEAGLPPPTAVVAISALKGAGVKELLGRLHKLAGMLGDVWVVGAQNAGKSSLINAFRKAAGRSKPGREITTATMPGTTLGLLKVPGLMPGGSRMFDTPGVPHRHQLSSVLSPDEVKLLLPRRRLKPRTYRLGPGQTVLIGGVARIDVLDSPGPTLYMTVWVSGDIACHMGKTEKADERYERFVGKQLTPPMGDLAERWKTLGALVPADLTVEGDSWRSSTVDIAIAGLGWVGIGANGCADFRVWAPKGVAVTTRSALVPDYAREFERPGFTDVELKKGAFHGQPPPGKGQGGKKGGRKRAVA